MTTTTISVGSNTIFLTRFGNAGMSKGHIFATTAHQLASEHCALSKRTPTTLFKLCTRNEWTHEFMNRWWTPKSNYLRKCVEWTTTTTKISSRHINYEHDGFLRSPRQRQIRTKSTKTLMSQGFFYTKLFLYLNAHRAKRFLTIKVMHTIKKEA